MTILSCCTGESIDSIEKRLQGCGYGILKEQVSNAIIEILIPIQERYQSFLNDKESLNAILDQGRDKASYFARKNLTKIKKKMGVGRIA